MDVELNPGPVGGESFLQQTQEIFERRFSQIMQCLHAQSMGLSRQMFDHFQSLGHSLRRVEKEVKTVKQDTKDNRSDISKLQQDSVTVHDRLEKLERDVD